MGLGIIAFFAFVCGISKLRYKEPVKYTKEPEGKVIGFNIL